MTLNESLTLLCEGCEIASHRHNDLYWGHLCDDCFTALCDPDWYYLTGEPDWPVDDATAWWRSGLVYAHLDPSVQRVASRPYPWEVWYP